MIPEKAHRESSKVIASVSERHEKFRKSLQKEGKAYAKVENNEHTTMYNGRILGNSLFSGIAINAITIGVHNISETQAKPTYIYILYIYIYNYYYCIRNIF